MLVQTKTTFADVVDAGVLAGIPVDADQEVRRHAFATAFSIFFPNGKGKEIDELLLTVGAGVGVDKRECRQAGDGRASKKVFATAGRTFFSEDRHGIYPQ